ncbi:Transposase InsO and inactivated derivatives [Actinomadura madurae]|uniref:Transposase InsO and inactivated derivatives n=1 Tax=Actinomadura madurae TaxID=1993 RepID=A0A1I5LS92_9ACTN|nr:Transposase InsO and inactivated derivatives [Actinomadura madurae]SFP73568.1 Transposase InsO and inactivated derivatives [Actinomadura madurae]SFQ48547.1 Transposase InsO and inactivated derivatives [Actinomadura madurae]
MGLVELSVVEQRYRAVLQVLAGVPVIEVAARFGVSRQSVHAWVKRYRAEGLAGLADRSRRPVSSPGQMSAQVEAVVCELRREHPRWGPVRIVHEIGRLGVVPVPSRMGVHRALVRHGLIEPGRRRRKREEFRRWEREEPMALWQMDIVGGVLLANGSECKVVTGVDDHSRFCVIAEVVPRATGRAVCLAFAAALREFGVPGEVLTDNGKQFTDRFGHGGEVLFDRICRDNGIVHRLTQPRSPTTTGKVERFHQSLRRELLDDAVPFDDLPAARAAVAGWVVEYNTRRPHQSLGMAFPADRFDTRTAQGEQELLPLRLPAAVRLAAVPPAAQEAEPADPAGTDVQAQAAQIRVWDGGAVEFERTVPASGNMFVAGRQFWLGPAQAGVTVTFWADTDVIHLLNAGSRIKSVRSHLSTADLTALAARGARKAGPPPLPPPEDGEAGEVDRTVNKDGNVGLGGRMVLAAEILRGRRVGIRIEPATLMFFDPQTRELLRTRPNPFTPDQVQALRGLRRAGPPPRPRTEPVTVQRRASNSGVVMVTGQKIALGRLHAGRVVTIHVADTTLAIELGDDDVRTVRRTTTQPVRSIKAHRPRKAAP